MAISPHPTGHTMSKDAAVKKAKRTAGAVKQSTAQGRKKVRTSLRFRNRNRTNAASQIKSTRVVMPARPQSMFKEYSIIRAPLTTEKAVKCIEEDNTLVFLCDPRANKPSIKQAVQKLFSVTVQKVNTLIRPDGQKKAYVRLSPNCEALEVSNKMGIL